MFYTENFITAMVMLNLLALMESKRFTRRGWSLIWGVSAALGLLVKWTFPVYVFIPLLLVTDRGSGMSADHVKQATEPFFSTKGHGMGLGLFLARSVAEQLDGSLELMSQENHGTTVRIRVPFSKFEEAPR